MDSIAYYAEYASGNCTVVRSADREQARKRASRGTRIPGDRLRIFREATDEDISHFLGMGGTIRGPISPEPRRNRALVERGPA